MTKLNDLHNAALLAVLDPDATNEQIIEAKGSYLAEVEATEKQISGIERK